MSTEIRVCVCASVLTYTRMDPYSHTSLTNTHTLTYTGVFGSNSLGGKLGAHVPRLSPFFPFLSISPRGLWFKYRDGDIGKRTEDVGRNGGKSKESGQLWPALAAIEGTYKI